MTKESKATPRRGGFSKDKILSVATRMFSEYGFAAISIRDIAGACDVSIPSIYHFFTDKESLYASCCEQIFHTVADRLNEALSQSQPGVDRIRRFTAVLCDILLNQHDFRRLLQRELLREERRGIDELTTHHFSKEFGLLGDEISVLMGSKSATERTFSIYALAFGLIQLRRISEVAGANTALEAERLAEHVLNIVLPGQDWSAKAAAAPKAAPRSRSRKPA